MASIDEGNRFAPPTVHVEDVAASTSALASRGGRLAAVIIDAVIQGIAVAVLSFVTPLSPFRPPADGALVGFMLTNLVLGLVLFLLLHGYLLATQGQTIGKKLLGIRIVRSDGSAATFGRLVGLRILPVNLIVLVPYIGMLIVLIDSLLIFRESRKCLHDNIADTIVVKA
ncbi:RDD family protein [Piscinibacter koreensis]|uniref:RDD family protein n=1 Tax=Piscinibacter koreensis TaxID=2742824 RepID=A0A7Y6NLS1_9BURK|nr:RDD family protein [Schlegelella koreensis]NUZ05422.1 RDD family protein [Schlegelella koreensis]